MVNMKQNYKKGLMKISPSILVLAFLFNVALVFIFGWNGLWFTPLIIGFVLWFTYRKKNE